LLEPCVAWLIELKNISRVKANLVIILLTWFLGLGSVLSFNIWSDYTLLGFNYFDFLDFLTANIMLPISGFLITIFVAYAINLEIVEFEMRGTPSKTLRLWEMAIRYIAPFSILLVFSMGVYDKFFS
jgi:NSS family neurotransmitter:Na+ symporter